ncbi:MAG: SPFH domain-containing protein [Armatimonadetes bacterium]|nr:SPFH domain-containing protein [Armatimonadota bacterium]
MREQERTVMNGWIMLPVVILAWLGVPSSIIRGGIIISQGDVGGVGLIILGILLIPTAILLTAGMFSLQPNEAQVLVLFGRYVGTVKKDGLHWTNPFSVHRGGWESVKEGTEVKAVTRTRSKYRVSLRARNFQTETLKVNDQRGNPIEIAAVVVWRVLDTAKALFDVDEYEHYVRIQSETAVRHVATSYPYDHTASEEDTDELTLRANTDEVSVALQHELQARLEKAGVQIEEARLTHLAYAPEIAGAMLRRQQAEAIIAARQKIVHGAVSMVEMALSELSEKKVIELDEERKAAMIGNLLVVLCGEAQAEPVINTGTLYH